MGVVRGPQLSLVVPCYNEEVRIARFEKHWRKFIEENGQRLSALFPEIEVVFVNDGSRDKTETSLKEAVLRMSRGAVRASYFSLPENKGKGAAVRKGFELVKGDWVLITDVDLSSPLDQLFKLIDAKVDFAMGSRALAESIILKAQRRGRPSLGRIFNRVMRLITGIPFRDTQCGFKLLRGSFAREAASQLIENRFAFDVELVLIASHLKQSIAEVAVEWEHQEPSRVMVWRDGLQMILRVVVLTFHHGRYEGAGSSERFE